MTHVFLLMVYLGTGDFRKPISQDMYFRDLNSCNWYASKIVKTYGNYSYSQFIDPKDRVTAYCIPKYVDASDFAVNLYD